MQYMINWTAIELKCKCSDLVASTAAKLDVLLAELET